MLELRSVARATGKKTLLEGVSLAIAEGEFLGVLGPSGSGKTTLLRLIAGLDEPTSGKISFGDRELSRAGEVAVKPEGRGIGMVFQDSALFPHLTVEGNVAFGAQKNSELVARLLASFGLTELRGRRIHALSGGERQRVALARAFAAAPKALLLDEPFSQVDRFARHELVTTVGKLAREARMTLVLVTHDVRDAVELGIDSVVVLDKGKVKRQGRFAEVNSNPGETWTKAFLESGFGKSTREENR